MKQKQLNLSLKRGFAFHNMPFPHSLYVYLRRNVMCYGLDWGLFVSLVTTNYINWNVLKSWPQPRGQLFHAIQLSLILNNRVQIITSTLSITFGILLLSHLSKNNENCMWPPLLNYIEIIERNVSTKGFTKRKPAVVHFVL